MGGGNAQKYEWVTAGTSQQLSLTVRQDLVGLGDLLEAFLRLVLVLRVLIRMPLESHLSVAASTHKTTPC